MKMQHDNIPYPSVGVWLHQPDLLAYLLTYLMTYFCQAQKVRQKRKMLFFTAKVVLRAAAKFKALLVRSCATFDNQLQQYNAIYCDVRSYRID